MARIFLLGLLLTTPASAQFGQHVMMPGPPSASQAPYTGLGDITTFNLYWDLRAYSQAIVTAGTQKLINVRRGSDNATADIIVSSNGGLGVTANASAGSNGVSVRTWGGIDATGTGSISGTTLTFTGGTIGDQVTGSGVTPGTYIIGGSSPTWTVNLSQTVLAETLTLYVGLFVTTQYGQTNTNNAVQATNTFAAQPALLLNVLNGGVLPTMAFTGTQYLLLAGTASSLPVYAVSVAERTGNFSNYGTFFGWQSSTQAGAETIFVNSANTIGMFSGSVSPSVSQSYTSDNVIHSVQALFNGGSSVINIDGHETTGNPGSAVPDLDGIGVGNTSDGLAGFTGFLTTTGVIGYGGTIPSSTVRGQIDTNNAAYWGT